MTQLESALLAVERLRALGTTGASVKVGNVEVSAAWPDPPTKPAPERLDGAVGFSLALPEDD